MAQDEAEELLLPFGVFPTPREALECARKLSIDFRISIVVRGSEVLLPESGKMECDWGFRAAWELGERRRGRWDEGAVEDERNGGDAAYQLSRTTQSQYERASEDPEAAYLQETLERTWDGNATNQDDG